MNIQQRLTQNILCIVHVAKDFIENFFFMKKSKWPQKDYNP